jgi:TonB-dependent SusC/RagA subfamily outer membrane receptor
MEPFTLYLLKANGVFILLFAFYLLFLHRDTFYKAKRAYLLGIIGTSVLLPLLHPAALIPQRESVQYVILLVGDSLNSVAHPETVSLSTMQLINLLLCIGIAGSLLLLLFRYLQLWWVMRGCREEVCHGNQKVYIPAKELNPFSYQGRIFLNPELYTEEELARIIRHEQAHIDQKHGIDLMLVAFFQSLVWMNPLYYWFARSVRENVEFLADQQVLRSGQDPKAYQYALLKVAQNSSLPLTQHFSISHLKKRIIMMNKKRTHSLWSSKYLLVVPLLIGTLLVVNAKELKDAWSNADFSQNRQPEAISTATDSTKQTQPGIVIIKRTGDSTHARPLILVEGKVISVEEMQRINPDEIESINVLKDKSAIQKYGTKGKNGVILITMKKAGKEKVIISINNVKQNEVTSPVTLKATLAYDNPGEVLHKDKSIPKDILIIKDGTEILPDIKSVPASEIESITVLKDSTATKIYGDKAKHGVILINTKKE